MKGLSCCKRQPLVEKGSVRIKRACLCQWIMHVGIFGPHPRNDRTLESINIVYLARPVALVSHRQTQNVCFFLEE